MYYLITEYEVPIFNHKNGRKLITIGNKTGFTDLYDHHPLYIEEKTVIIPEDELEEFMKDGFKTKKEAENANEMKENIKNFIGPLVEVDFKIISETELLQKYKNLK